ncbi:MAG: hypothetical protein HY752_00125 [Nitrospirae bacterium]|nr:hypothetical protein [Nitrospirota bacterium]
MKKVIDIHTHGIGGYDTKTITEAEILKIAETHGSYGVSEIILAVYPATIKAMRENMAVIKKAMEMQVGIDSFRDAGSKEIGNSRPAKVIGIHLEGPFLNPSKCGALNAMAFIKPTEKNFKELIDGFEDVVKIITIASEVEGAIVLIKRIAGMGIIASMGHSDATYTEAEAGYNAGAKGITHIFNAMRSFHHREPGISGFGLLNQDVYIEVIADPYHLHPKTLKLIFKVKNPERIIIVSDTVKKTKTLPHLETHGVTDAHGKLLGGCMSVIESAERLIEIGYDKGIINQCITENPERYLRQSQIIR